MAVNGIAFTLSIELALAADIAIAADDARFRQLEIGRGIIRPAGPPSVRPKAAWITAGAHVGIPADGVFHVGRQRERVAPDYVLFPADLEETAVLANPPTVGIATTPGQVETWTSDPFAVGLRALLLCRHRSRRKPWQCCSW